MTVAERLKELRYKLGLSQKEFAEKVGIHYMTLSKYESGKYHPSLRFLKKVEEVFNVNPQWLLQGVGEMFLPKDKPTEAVKAELLGLKGASLDSLAEELAEKVVTEAMMERGFSSPDSLQLYPDLVKLASEKLKAFYHQLKAEIGFYLDTLEKFSPPPKHTPQNPPSPSETKEQEESKASREQREQP